MRVNQAELVQAAQAGLASTAATKDAPRTSFAAALAKSSAAADKADAPKGATTRKVEGHDYVEITSGPRNGMFLNMSDNARRGEAFVLKRGAEYNLHIYGSGKDRRVIKVPHERDTTETTRKVEDHPYVEITSGPRNGMFINKTHNERRGEAFVLKRRDDHDLHIYGSGSDRRVIISWHKDQPAHRDEYADAVDEQSG